MTLPTTLKGLRYRQVDVFAHEALSGNGLTVFWDAGALHAETMLRLTREMRQFESIFLSPGEVPLTFRARIFTMEEELDFAGHPVLGAAAVLHEKYGKGEVEAWTLTLNQKSVPVRTERTADGFRATMDQGKPEFGRRLSPGEAAPFLDAHGLASRDVAPGLPLQVVSTGLPYLVIPVISGLERTRIVASNFEQQLATVGAKFAYVVNVADREGRTWDNFGGVEDIATGSAAGPVGAFLRLHGVLRPGERLLLRQGRFLGRPSVIEVEVAGEASDVSRVHVSGGVVPVATGVFDEACRL